MLLSAYCGRSYSKFAALIIGFATTMPYQPNQPFRVMGSDVVMIKEGGQLYYFPDEKLLFMNGFNWADVQDCASVPFRLEAPHNLEGLLPSKFFAARNNKRAVANSYLMPGMRGVEIGAGPYPHPLPPNVDCDYYDKRASSELETYFGTDASVNSLAIETLEYANNYDFLIAHHCLEHCVNPVQTLIEWQASLKQTALACISVPDASRTYDRDRIVAPIDHHLFDYAFDRQINEYDNRIHVHEFVFSWRNDPYFGPMSKEDLATSTFKAATMPGGDCHWHAWNLQALIDVIDFAAYFSNRRVTFLETYSASEQDSSGSLNDALVVYALTPGWHDFYSESNRKVLDKFRKRIGTIHSKLATVTIP
jgi:hypothetical protein